MNDKRLFSLCVALFFTFTIIADTGRYRLMFNDDPATEITIGFDTSDLSGNPPILYYSTVNIDTSNISNYSSTTDYIYNFSYGMHNHFITLKNLQPNSTYYFTVNEGNSFSEVYNFKTLPADNNAKLSIIAGSDTQNQSELTKTAFKMFSKLNPHFILFQGDFIKYDNIALWQRWLDDWQFSISENNRIIPIVVARGNLDTNSKAFENLFNRYNNGFGALTFGENLLRLYTLNSEISIYGKQTIWLSEDLKNQDDVIWKLAHYHSTMRPHSLFKKEGSRQYANWANLFYQYNVNVAIEGEGQNVKVTWPLKPCSGGYGCDQGFIRTSPGGTVYLGEGTLDCPLRYDTDNKKWTRQSGTFNQFKWLFIDSNQIESRTVVFDQATNVDIIDQLEDSNRFMVPQNLEIWNPDGGDFVLFKKNNSNISCTIIEPEDNSYMPQRSSCVTLIANAASTNGISKVDFFINGVFLGSSITAPYVLSWYPSANGNYVISAKATDISGFESNVSKNYIFIGDGGPISTQSLVDINCEELYENKLGTIYDRSARIKIADSNVAAQGLQFTDLNIPPGAKILSANIQFTAEGSNSLPTSTLIKCVKSDDISPFIKERRNISKRPVTDNYVTWQVPAWIKNERTINQKTIDLSSIVQEVVDMPGWNIQNPLTFMFSGVGSRSAKSHYSIVDSINQNKADVPKLSIEYLASCPYNLFVSTCNLFSGETYSAQNKLYSNQPIPSNMDNIQYNAGTIVEFGDNFEVSKNTNFSTGVTTCY